ncbi:deoxyhypusine synthase family protein [Candidatus Woesearchaeota archaeon]|nr:deoxyhypusine synthase family protein [Candidatus Woesearchaeota archaeon]
MDFENKKADFKVIKSFIDNNFLHFNAAVVKDAAKGYVDQLKKGNKMMITLAGAMSTAELGKTLAEMIRQGKVHAITCTGANLEEDLFNLVAHDHYRRVPDYKDLTPDDELRLLENGMNRVTDTCIPEEEAMMVIDREIVDEWSRAEKSGKRMFPHEFIYNIIRSGVLEGKFQIDPKDSWIIAACEKNLPIFVPGWEDSTLGNSFVSEILMNDKMTKIDTVRSGLEYMHALVNWYWENSKDSGIGFFQIGGGIAGDFAICVVPLINHDLPRLNRPAQLWSFFCQISDSTTSYGSYSGAVPNEKITWGKLGVDTPKFVIESDATIVAPLIFAYVLAS